MQIKLLKQEMNTLLKRKEVNFKVDHNQEGRTPSRPEIKKNLAMILKVDENLVFIRRMRTITGTHVTIGEANVYETIDQAKLVEPAYIIKRNLPESKPAEEAKT
jgi:ribosomal protein S24E